MIYNIIKLLNNNIIIIIHILFTFTTGLTQHFQNRDRSAFHEYPVHEHNRIHVDVNKIQI